MICNNNIDKINESVKGHQIKKVLSAHMNDMTSFNIENTSFNFQIDEAENFESEYMNNAKSPDSESKKSSSSAYLEDYLQLLTTRSNFSPMSTKSVKSDIGCNVGPKGRHPKRRRRSFGGISNNSDLRSLGSNYLDNYLVNLTDFSWIIYPTESKSVNNSLTKSVTFDLEKNEDESPSSVCSSPKYLRRKLRFIDPESFFFKPSPSSSEEPHSESYRTNATSPDISSSIFDITKNESPKSSESLSIDGGCLDSEKSEDCTTNSSSGIASMSLENNNSNLGREHSSNNSSSGIGTEESVIDDEPIDINNDMEPKAFRHVVESRSKAYDIDRNRIKFSKPPSMHFHHKGRKLVNSESKIEEETSSSSDISSATTEPSTIILAGEQEEEQQLSLTSATSDLDQRSRSDLEKKRTSKLTTTEEEYEKLLEDLNVTDSKGDRTTPSSSSATSDNVAEEDSLISDEDGGSSWNESKFSYLIQLLKKKQQKELDELSNKHKTELNSFVNQLRRLSETQMEESLTTNESPQNTLESSSMCTSLTKSAVVMNDSTITNCSFPINIDDMNTTDNNYNSTHCTNEFIDRSDDSAYRNDANTEPPTTPSFFLHRDNENKNENCQISQLFSSARSNDPQSITEMLERHPQILIPQPAETNSNNGPTSVSDHNERSGNEPQVKIGLEVGLDLVPARESDLASLNNKILEPQHVRGICLLQAHIRGRRTRKLLKTFEVEQLLGTLKEVAKLSREFHKDVLSDNIKKGDVGFHRALFNQEQQTKEKLHRLLIETSAVEQMKTIRKDRLTRMRKSSAQLRNTRTKSATVSSSVNSSRQSSTTAPSPKRGGRIMKQVIGRVMSEPPRLCRTIKSPAKKSPHQNLPFNATTSTKSLNNNANKWVAATKLPPKNTNKWVPATKALPNMSGSVTPKSTTVVSAVNNSNSRKKLQETQKKSVANESQNKVRNAHLCKTELALPNKNVSLPRVRTENVHSQKSWR